MGLSVVYPDAASGLAVRLDVLAESHAACRRVQPVPGAMQTAGRSRLLRARRLGPRMGIVTTSTGTASEFRVLGPVEAVRAGQPVRLGGRRQRWLLALLLVEPGRALSSDRLIDELWQGKPTPGAEGTLRVYISRLRSALDENMLVARPPGYVLDIEAELVDAWRFERLYREGRDALARGAAGLAADRLGAALALWHGPAFADVRDGGVVADEASLGTSRCRFRAHPR